MSIPPHFLAQLTQQFLDNYVPGVVRSRIVYDEDTETPRDIYIDVAAGHDPEFVSRAVQRVMTDRFQQPVPPHHIHLQQTDEAQLRPAAEQLKYERPDVQILDAAPELDALLAARDAGTDDAGAFEFQRIRASTWYDIRDAEIDALQDQDAIAAETSVIDDDSESGSASETEREAPPDDFDAQREAFLSGDTSKLIVAHPDIRDALVNSLRDAFQEAILTPARQAGRDMVVLQDTVFSEWLILAAERLALPSRPFDDFPEDPYGVGSVVSTVLALPVPLAIAPSVVHYETATKDERRKAMRDAVVGMVSLEDIILQPAFHDRFDPFAVETALLLVWITLAAEHADVSAERIKEVLPDGGDPLDDLVQRASSALEQLCLDQGLAEPLIDEDSEEDDA